MNDLMTSSFQNYVELKKQALRDLESGPVPDLEAGRGLNEAEEENLMRFFEDIGAIQFDMEDISNLLLDLQQLNQESKSIHSPKILRGLRDRMDSNMVAVLRKAKNIKDRLEDLDGTNAKNRRGQSGFAEGSNVDRIRISVTNGLRTKLGGVMNDFQSLREQILDEHKENLKRRYFSATGELATDEVIENILSGSVKFEFSGNEGGMDLEIKERQKAVSDLQKSLTRLHQVFLDMAVIVEAQDEQLNDIEENVIRAKDYVSEGTGKLVNAHALQKSRRYTCWIWIFIVMAVMLVCLIAVFRK